jgi:hypothetical protein
MVLDPRVTRKGQHLMTETTAQVQVTPTVASDIVDRYVAVWNEPDPAARDAAIAGLWAPDATEFLDSKSFYGHDELAGRVARAHEAFVATGKYAVTSAGDLARHHDIITFTAQLTTPAGEVDWESRIFLLIGADGLIQEDYQLTVKPLPA